MNGENIISFTPTNWITVVLMVLGFYMLVGLGARLWQQRQAAKGG